MRNVETERWKEKGFHHWMKTRKSCLTVVPVGTLISLILFTLICYVAKFYQYGGYIFWIILGWTGITAILLYRWFRFIPSDGPKGGFRMLAYLLYMPGLGCMLGGINAYIHDSTSSLWQVERLTQAAIGEHEFISSNSQMRLDTENIGIYYELSKVQRGSRTAKRYEFHYDAYITIPVINSNGVFYAIKIYGENQDYYNNTDTKAALKYFESQINEESILNRINYHCRLYHQILPNMGDNYELWAKSARINNPAASYPIIVETDQDIQVGEEAEFNYFLLTIFLISMTFIFPIFLYYGLKKESQA